MFKQFIGFAAAAAACVAWAQTPVAQTDTPSPASAAASEPGATPQDEPKAAPVPAVLGLIRERTYASYEASPHCRPSSRAMPRLGIVVVVRKFECSEYRSSQKEDYFEVVFAGKTRYVRASAVGFTPDGEKHLADLQPEQIEASRLHWKATSLRFYIKAMEDAINTIEATSKHGVALMSHGVYDVSEHTEGTGFTASVQNTSKKTIKYVVFTVTGLNAVGDPVRGGSRGGGVGVLRGIGPIEPGERATYSQRYMWNTDLVQTHRISSIKLEFMDGTSRVISDVKKIRISEDHQEILAADID